MHSAYGADRYISFIKKFVYLNTAGKFKITVKGENGLLFNLKQLRDQELKYRIQFEVDAAIAFAGQYVLEEILLHMLKFLRNSVETQNICVSGGVALNSLAMGRLARESGFENVYLHFSSGDSGIAIGAAAWGHAQNNPFELTKSTFNTDPYLGKHYTNSSILALLNQNGISFTTPSDLYMKVGSLIAAGKIVAWFQGRSEFGPRALGNRSLLADPRYINRRDHLNSRIKMREWFRPLAPSVISSEAVIYFKIDAQSPYMQFVWPVREFYWSELPAITHANNMSRIQTVSESDNPRYFQLINAFREYSQCPMLLNTSFNTHGEPIVETPYDALQTFINSDIDCLVLEDHLIVRS